MTHPITGARYPSSGSAPNGPQQIQNAVSDLSVQVLPRFTDTTARDNAFATWTAAGNTIAEGMFAYTTGDDTLWYYNGTTWTWPKWAQGEKGRADYTSNAGLANTDTGLPSFNLTTSFIPSGRRLKLEFVGAVSTDTAGAFYSFSLYQGNYGTGTQLRLGTVQVPNASAGQHFNISRVFNTSTNLTNQLWTVGGQRSSLSGTFTLLGGNPSGAVQYRIEDLGAV